MDKESTDHSGRAERRAKHLEAQFAELYGPWLERECRSQLRSEIYCLYAVDLVYARFSAHIRRESGVVLNFVLKNGLSSFKQHPYLRDWLEWAISAAPERLAQRLEAQFAELFWPYLERKCRNRLRSEIDHLGAVTRISARFADHIRRKDSEVLAFIVENGLVSFKNHQFFRRWVYWAITDEIREFYKSQPDVDHESNDEEQTLPSSRGQKGSFVPLDQTQEIADDLPDIEDQLDEMRFPSRSFLERIVAPLVTTERVSQRNADIYVSRLTGFRQEGDTDDRHARQPTLAEIGNYHKIGTSQVDRIVRRVQALIEKDEGGLIREALRMLGPPKPNESASLNPQPNSSKTTREGEL